MKWQQLYISHEILLKTFKMFFYFLNCFQIYYLDFSSGHLPMHCPLLFMLRHMYFPQKMVFKILNNILILKEVSEKKVFPWIFVVEMGQGTEMWFSDIFL